MSMVPFPLLIVVANDSLTIPSVKESILESMIPFRIRMIESPDDDFNNRSTRKDFSISIKKMRITHVGNYTNRFQQCNLCYEGFEGRRQEDSGLGDASGKIGSHRKQLK